jgi:hypothetical protein
MAAVTVPSVRVDARAKSSDWHPPLEPPPEELPVELAVAVVPAPVEPPGPEPVVVPLPVVAPKLAVDSPAVAAGTLLPPERPTTDSVVAEKQPVSTRRTTTQRNTRCGQLFRVTLEFLK